MALHAILSFIGMPIFSEILCVIKPLCSFELFRKTLNSNFISHFRLSYPIWRKDMMTIALFCLFMRKMVPFV